MFTHAYLHKPLMKITVCAPAHANHSPIVMGEFYLDLAFRIQVSVFLPAFPEADPRLSHQIWRITTMLISFVDKPKHFFKNQS